MPIHFAEDLPDLDEADINRAVPTVATGVEKEEEEVGNICDGNNFLTLFSTRYYANLLPSILTLSPTLLKLPCANPFPHMPTSSLIACQPLPHLTPTT